ncbi:hypothetical protein D9M69_673980 [compost metagenome]
MMASARAPSRRSMASSTWRCWSCATTSMSRACGECACTTTKPEGEANGRLATRSSCWEMTMLPDSSDKNAWNFPLNST